MRRSPFLPAALLALAAPAALLAQQPPAGGGRPPKPAVDLALDADGDEVISAAEIANAASALKKLDLDGNGRLAPEELRPKRADGAPGGGQGKSGAPPAPPDGPGGAKKPLPPIVVALDADGDGTVSAAELASAPTRLKKLDANGNGRLEPDEYRPPRPDEGYAGSDSKARPRSAP